MNKEYKEMIYEKERKKPEILLEGKYKNYQFYIVSLGTHPTAYVKIPIKSKFFGKDYFEIDIDVHGGLTYSKSTLSVCDDKLNSWFIGWDYAHYDDYNGIYENTKLFDFPFYQNGKKWTVKEIFEDVILVIEQIIIADERFINEQTRIN